MTRHVAKILMLLRRPATTMVCAAALLSGCDFAHRLPDAPGQVYYDKDQKPQSVLAGGKSGIQSGVVVIEVPTPPQPAAESDAMFAQTPRPALAAPTSGGAVAPKALELPPATNGGGAPAINGMRTNGSVLAALTGRAQADSRNKAEAQMKPMTAQAAPIPPAPQMAAPQTASPQTAAPMRMAAEAPKPAMADYGAMAAKPAAPMQADRFRAIIPEGVTVVDVAPGAASAPQPMAPPAMAMAAPQPMTPPAAAPTAAPRISAPQMAAAQSEGDYVQLDGGQVVLIRPLIGAPAEAGMALARALAQSVGSPADAAVWRASPKRLTLSGSAIETAAGAGRALAVDWRLSDANGAQVGAFVERQAVNAGGADLWASVNGDMLVSLGRRTADRMSRALTPTGPQAPRMAAAPAPAAPVMAAAIAQEPAAAAPRPRLRPARAMAMAAPQPTAPQTPAPQLAMIAPQPTAPKPADIAMAPQTRPQPAPTMAPAPDLAYQPPADRPAPTQAAATTPLAAAAAPAPSFDSLRPADTVASGPRPLVFRGVFGAPGDGDNALAGAVRALLARTGERLAPAGTPDSLYLSAQVSRSSGAQADQVRIIWRVEDHQGRSIGQVVQENDVPAGSLDGAWGQDATYAAEGARDGILELLKAARG